MRRLTAFQEKLHLYRGQNVQVLGVTVDDAAKTAEWAKSIGVTFPLIADREGTVSRAFGMFDQITDCSARALALVHDGRIVRSERVASTEIPIHFRPWLEIVVEAD